MNAEDLKAKLNEIFRSGIIFNKEFDELAESIKNVDSNFLEWCESVKSGKVVPAIPKKERKNLAFIKKIGSSNRCIVIKVVNGEFTEIHLGNHDYYDKLRKRLGLKENTKSY